MVPAANGKAAVTHWTRIAQRDGRSLIAFAPRTGRTHQIRVHALHGFGFGIVGDPVYGQAGGPMLLHGRFLSVPRPNKPPAQATAPLPASFAAAGFPAEMLDDAGV